MNAFWIVSILVVIVVIYFALKKFEDLSGKTEAELREYFTTDGNELFWRNVIREMKNRGLNIDFVKTDIIELMLSSNLRDRVIGCECFKEVFPDDIVFDPKGPSDEVIRKLQEIKTSLSTVEWEQKV